jgi:hypothetical protein
VFTRNAANLVGSVIEAINGTTESTCWTDEQLLVFFGDETPEDTVPVTPPPPAKMTKVAFSSGNIAQEGSAGELTITYDKAGEKIGPAAWWQALQTARRA